MAYVEKKIYLYNFTTSLSLTGIFDAYNTKLNHDLSRLLERRLIFSSPVDNYNYFLDIIDKVPVKTLDNTKASKVNYYYKCILYKLRDKELPYIFNIQTGNKNLINITPKDTIMEQTHFLAFPEINLLVSEYNNNGARIEKLRSIIDYALDLKSLDFSIDPILKTDNYKQVLASKGIKSLTVKTGHAGIKSLNEVIGLNILDDLNNEYDELTTLELEITISGTPRKKLSIANLEKRLDSITKVAKNLLGDKNNDKIKKGNISKLKAKIYDDNNLVPIDLLEEKLVYIPQVAKVNDRSKYLDSDDMFSKLFEAYNISEDLVDRIVKVYIESPKSEGVDQAAVTK